MHRLQILNPDLKLEVKVIDSEGKYFFANKILVNYLDEQNRLLIKDLTSISTIELFFSRTEEKCDLKVSDITDLLINGITIDLTVDIYDDNHSVESYDIDTFTNKAVLILKTEVLTLEPLDEIPFIDIASNFIDYSEEEEVVEFLYEDYKEVIYRNLNIKTSGDFLASLENENTYNYAVGYIEEKLKLMSKNDLESFIKEYHDSEFTGLNSF